MKSNYVNMLAALAEEELGFFFIVQLDFNSNYFYTTLPYDVVWNGNTYRSETNILSFESPRATTVVDRQTYKLRLSGLDPVMIAEVESGIIHMPVSIRMGFIIDGVAQLGIDELMYVYSGTVANIKKEVSDGTQSINIECSAPLSSLDAKSTLFTTRDGLRVFSATDTSFNQIFEGSAEFSLNWGKTTVAATSPPLSEIWAGIGVR